MTGVDRFAHETLIAIDELIKGHDTSLDGVRFKVLVPPKAGLGQRFTHIPIEEYGSFSGQLWEQLDLPRAIGKEDLLLSLCNTGPVFCNRHIVVIHDAATIRVPASYSRAFRLWYRVLMPLLGMFARRVLTVSEFSRKDIASAFGIPAKKIGVVAEGGEHILRVQGDDSVIQRFGLPAGRYALAVGSMAMHKNFRFLLDAFSKIRSPSFELAVVGGANNKIFGAADLDEAGCVKRLGYVSDGELRALYENAMCFVFPSVYEGFGIPPLEAMVCGCPVLASNAASIPEVCGEAALYFNPRKTWELSDLLGKISCDEYARASLINKGRDRGDQFSWKNTARQVVSECLGIVALGGESRDLYKSLQQ